MKNSPPVKETFFYLKYYLGFVTTTIFCVFLLFCLSFLRLSHIFSFSLFFFLLSTHCSVYMQSQEHKIPQRDAFPCQNTQAAFPSEGVGALL